MIASIIDETTLLIPILEIGAVIIFSLIVAKVLGKRGIPQVLGLIFAGIFLQFITFLTNFPSPPTPELHYIITTGALGFIGYSIGAHLDLRHLKEESVGLILVLIGNTIGAFILVFIACIVVFQDLGLSLMLAAIATATAPASTAEVIGEYKSSGPLSKTVLFIIALDDILAIIIFNIALFYSESFYSGLDISIVSTFVPVLMEFIGSIILGVILAIAMKPFHIEGVEASQSAEFVFPTILICIALAGILHLSVILSCIVFGLVLSNLAECDCPDTKSCVMGVERLSGPLIALFFILVGFEMELGLLLSTTVIGLIEISTLVVVMIYFITRALGKSLGSYVTAKMAKMPDKVTRYIPFTLLTQAGVAVGLAAFAVSRLDTVGTEQALQASAILLNVIAVSVLLAEIIGPLLLKWAITKAGEVGQAITTITDESLPDGACSD
ncbi:MAG: cation:proton antiporter [Candidatus Hodarchaeales archaeon]